MYLKVAQIVDLKCSHLGCKKKEILPFVTSGMDKESIALSEIRQSEEDKCHMISLICGI